MKGDLVFLDVETSGLDPEKHELLEVAAIWVDRKLRVLDGWSAKVRPEPGWFEHADPAALELCGYNDEEWADASPLRDVLSRLSCLTYGAAPAGHNVWFDLAFLTRGFERCGLPMPQMDYRRLDTASFCWQLFAMGEASEASLDASMKALGIHARRVPHRAFGDACAALEVTRRMCQRANAAKLISDTERRLRGLADALHEEVTRGTV